MSDNPFLDPPVAIAWSEVLDAAYVPIDTTASDPAREAYLTRWDETRRQVWLRSEPGRWTGGFREFVEQYGYPDDPTN